MTKKLEPGCKAITVNCLVPENNGKIVTVIEYLGCVAGCGSGNVWLTDGKFVSILGVANNYMPADKLRRIDNKEETTTWEAMRDLWVPEQVRAVEKHHD